MAEKESLKLSNVRSRRGDIVVYVNSLTYYFLVPQREYIRMVYNGTPISLNISLWDTHFVIPMVGSNLRAAEKGTFVKHW